MAPQSKEENGASDAPKNEQEFGTGRAPGQQTGPVWWGRLNWTAWLQVVFSACLVFFAYKALDIADRQAGIADSQAEISRMVLELSRNQMALSVDPIISLPDRRVKAENGVFSLALRNTGVSEISSVEVYETCFLMHRPVGGNLTPHPSVRYVVTSNQPRIEQLPAGETATIEVACKGFQDKVNQVLKQDPPGFLSQVLLVRLVYQRSLDGKTFTKNKCYQMALSGDSLSAPIIDDMKPSDGIVTFAEMKAELGCE